MNNNIHPCIWYDGNAKAAAEFYCSLFPDSKITSVSFMVVSESDDEINELWKKLSHGAMVMMALDKYDWSEKYGFLQDKFGLSWQIFKGKYSEVNQKITPTFLFVGNNYGRAEAAVKYYTEVFPASSINGILLYQENEGAQVAGKVKHSQFILDGKVFMAMDGYGNHNFAFNEAISFVVECKDQQEIDYFWSTLTANGGKESQCGWLKDQFGVSWQIVPTVLGKLMSDPAKAGKVMQAFMQMKKFDIAALEKAAE